MTAAHLFLDRIGSTLGDRTALHDVTLLAQGGVTAVLGPNGCGKSTMLRCAATVLVPDEGSVRIDGLDPLVEPERIEARRRLGYAPQEAGFDGRLRVFDAVDYVAVLKGVNDTRRRRRAVFDAIDRVGLADRVRERVGELSGGMKRRLVLAQSLLGAPSLLVLDEPSAGLDPDERGRLREIVTERRGDATVLLATHLVDEVAAADTVIVLTAGTARFAGTPTQLAARAAGRVWIETALPPPGVRASWRRADGRSRCLGHPPIGAELVEPTVEEGYLAVLDDALAAPC